MPWFCPYPRVTGYRIAHKNNSLPLPPPSIVVRISGTIQIPKPLDVTWVSPYLQRSIQDPFLSALSCSGDGVSSPEEVWCHAGFSWETSWIFFFFLRWFTSFLSEAPVIPMLDLPGYNPLIFFIFSSYSLHVRIWFQGEAFSFIFSCTGWIFNALFPDVLLLFSCSCFIVSCSCFMDAALLSLWMFLTGGLGKFFSAPLCYLCLL